MWGMFSVESLFVCEYIYVCKLVHVMNESVGVLGLLMVFTQAAAWLAFLH